LGFSSVRERALRGGRAICWAARACWDPRCWGRGGESVSINAANGNLLVAQQDEFLAGRGLDIGISRTYNSLAQTTDGDNNDQWQMGTVRRLANLTGTLNTAGSTIQRLGSDGSLVTYSYGTRDGVAATAMGRTTGWSNRARPGSGPTARARSPKPIPNIPWVRARGGSPNRPTPTITA